MKYVLHVEYIFDMMILNDEILGNEFIIDGEISGY
jgi:hypothetical protein